MPQYKYEYPRPAVSADCLIIAWQDGQLKILLIQRGRDPYQGHWALPGGFLEMDENLDEAAKRELEEETGLTDIQVEQFGAYGDVGRDPRGRVITIAYLAMVRMEDHDARANDDANDAQWFPLYDLPELAFDHKQITDDLKRHFSIRAAAQPFGFELLPTNFHEKELRALYDLVLGKQLKNEDWESLKNSLSLLKSGNAGLTNS